MGSKGPLQGDKPVNNGWHATVAGVGLGALTRPAPGDDHGPAPLLPKGQDPRPQAWGRENS